MYKKENMVFKDYKWTARADHDNPQIIAGSDAALLNREEGYEMLYFINSLAKSWNWQPSTNISSYQHLEKIIKTEVPSTTRSHSKIKAWIEANYKTRLV